MMTATTELIAEAREGNFEDRGWMIDVIDRLADALEVATAAPSDTDEPTEREKVLDEVFTNLADQGWDVAIADDPVKGVSIDIQPVPSDTDSDVKAWIDKTLALPMYQNAISEYGQGVVETLRTVRKLLDGGMHPDTRAAVRTPQPSTVTEERAGYLGERSVDAQNTLSLGVIDAPEFLVEAVGRIARERGVSRATAVRQLLAARLTPAQPERNAICAECGCVGYHAINCPAARLTPAHPEQVTGVLAEIQAEVVRSTEKHGDQNHLPLGTGDQVSLLHGQDLAQPFEHVPVTMGTFAYTARNVTDDAAQGGCVTWADILLEEVAEALAEDSPTGVRAEAVQVAAVAVKIINAIDAAAVTPESGEKR